MLEKELESKLSNYARSVGVLSYKFSSPASRGVPDRMFIGPLGVLFLELKVGSNKPTKLQHYHIDQINRTGAVNTRAAWVNDFESGKRMIDMLVRNYYEESK